MKKLATVNTALQKATAHKTRPEIPSSLTKNFGRWTHCEVRTYHQRPVYKTPKGKKKKSRRVTGFIFIFLTNGSGATTRKPIRIMRKSNMTRRNFADYARKLTGNIDQALFHALENKTTH